MSKEELSGLGELDESGEWMDNNPNETQEEQEDSEQDQNTQTSPTGVDSPWQDDDLKGRTPEEVENLYKTLRDQNRQMQNLMALQPTAPTTPVAPTPPPEPEVEISDDDFYKDPVKTIQKLLNKSIEPFRQDLARSQSQLAWDEAKSRIEVQGGKDFSVVRPFVEKFLTASGVTTPSADQISVAYFNVKGYASMKGINLGEATKQPDSTPTSTQPKPPPQHKASSQPLKGTKGQDEEKPLRQLTENERRIAREQGLTHKQYLELQEMDMAELIPVEENK